MCYSARVWADYRKYVRAFGADIDVAAFERLYFQRQDGVKHKTPKGMDDALLAAGPAAVANLVRQWNLDQAALLEREMFKQAKRLADAQRQLVVKVTKAATENERISTNKVAWTKEKLADLRRIEPLDRDARIFPGMVAPVMIQEGGKRIIRPMRYQCRPKGKPAFYDTKFPGTYNARRDSLERFWREQFGHTHALMVAERFYENVETPEGNTVLEFVPRTGEPMLIACLYSHWMDPNGKAPDLWSFAAITDEPEVEVAAAGHDRTIINLKPEYVDRWLVPEHGNLSGLYAMFDDKAHPYYEHRKAA